MLLLLVQTLKETTPYQRRNFLTQERGSAEKILHVQCAVQRNAHVRTYGPVFLSSFASIRNRSPDYTVSIPWWSFALQINFRGSANGSFCLAPNTWGRTLPANASSDPPQKKSYRSLTRMYRSIPWYAVGTSCTFPHS